MKIKCMTTDLALKILTTVGVSAMLASCGQLSQANQPVNKPVKSKATQLPPQGLPQGAIIAVPVNEQGEEQPDQAQMRILTSVSDSTALSDQAIAAAFSKGQSPDRELNELDQSTSSESYRGWTRYRSYGRYYSNNNGFGFNQRYRYGFHNRGCNNYRFFQPTYYYAGTPYAWQYQSSFADGGMNYYYYHR
jgi:hypothetical protein